MVDNEWQIRIQHPEHDVIVEKGIQTTQEAEQRERELNAQSKLKRGSFYFMYPVPKKG